MTKILNKKNKRKAAIFLLCLILIFMFASYQQQAEAYVQALAVVGVAVCAYLLVVYGVYFVDTGDAQAAAEAMYSHFTTRIDEVATLGKLIWNTIKSGYQYVVTLGDDLAWDIKMWVDEKYNVGQNYIEEEVQIGELGGSITGENGDKIILGLGTTEIENENGNRWYKLYHYYDGALYHLDYYKATTAGAYELQSENISEVPKELNIYHDVYNWNIKWGTTTIQPSINIAWYTTTAINPVELYGQDGIVDNPTYDWVNAGTLEKDIPIDIGNDIPQVLNPDEEYGNDIIWIGSLGQLLGLDLPALQELLEELIGAKAEDITNEKIEGVEIEEGDTINDDTIEDELSEDYKPTTEQERSIKALVMTKFPFCIPWDIKNAFTLLAASPEAPHFTVDPLSPFIGAGVAEIEFNMEDYALVGTICRWMFTVEFCLVLAAASKKLIWG